MWNCQVTKSSHLSRKTGWLSVYCKQQHTSHFYHKSSRFLLEYAGPIFNSCPQHSCCRGRFVAYDACIHWEFKDPVLSLLFNLLRFIEESSIIDLRFLNTPRNFWKYFSTSDGDLALKSRKFSSNVFIQLFKRKWLPYIFSSSATYHENGVELINVKVRICSSEKKKYGALADSAFEGDALLTNSDLLYETQHPNDESLRFHNGENEKKNEWLASSKEVRIPVFSENRLNICSVHCVLRWGCPAVAEQTAYLLLC